MFDVLPKALASVASFLFPLFASYKALNSADPAQLTPWLMYWVVLNCALLVESWTDWLLVWVPFYHYLRLLFLLYLVLPQTQGARLLYQAHLHPWLREHEAHIDEFIGSAHDRLRSAGMHYLKQAVAYLRVALGLPAHEETTAAPSSSSSSSSSSPSATTTPQSYTQALLARFTLPGARWPGGAGQSGPAPSSGGAAAGAGAGAGAGADFYGLLASAVGALGTAAGATGAVGGVAAGAAASAIGRGLSSAAGGGGKASPSTLTASGTLVPPHVRDADRASFLATQRDRLRTLLSALDREAAQLDGETNAARASDDADADADADTGSSQTSPLSRPLSSASGLSKSRSEADFEKIDAESGAEDELPVRRRGAGGGGRSAASTPTAPGHAAPGPHPGAGQRSASGSWMPWAWGGGGGGGGATGDGATGDGDPAGTSSAVDK